MSERKVWVVTIPDYYEYDVPAGYEVLIEQFGDNAPTLAFRPDRRATWAAPIASERR